MRNALKYCLNPGVNFVMMMVCCAYAVYVDISCLYIHAALSTVVNAITFVYASGFFEKRWKYLIISPLVYVVIAFAGTVVFGALLYINVGNDIEGAARSMLYLFIGAMYLLSLLTGNAAGYLLAVIRKRMKKRKDID